MFCNNCGKEIDDNAVVCPHCGVATAKLNEAKTEEPKKRNLCAILGLVFALVQLVVGYIPVAGTALSWITWVAAFVLSIVGIVLANKKNYGQKGCAVAGLVISLVGVILTILLMTVLAALLVGIGSAL